MGIRFAFISKEGVDAIRTAVNELVSAGYVIRSRRRNQSGQLSDADYTIYEFPQNNNNDNKNTACISEASSIPTDYASVALTSDSPTPDKPMSDNSTLEKPTLGSPTLENRTQINKDSLLIHQQILEL